MSKVDVFYCFLYSVTVKFLEADTGGSQDYTYASVSFLINTFSTEHTQATASEVLQKNIDKFKECQTNKSTKKIHLRRKMRKAWNRRKRTQMAVTVIEGLAVPDKG